jgi:hypothetical protein
MSKPSPWSPGAKKQKSWLSDQSFAKKFGFEVVDTTDNGYELLALSFDRTTPKFAQSVKNQADVPVSSITGTGLLATF